MILQNDKDGSNLSDAIRRGANVGKAINTRIQKTGEKRSEPTQWPKPLLFFSEATHEQMNVNGSQISTTSVIKASVFISASLVDLVPAANRHTFV